MRGRQDQSRTVACEDDSSARIAGDYYVPLCTASGARKPVTTESRTRDPCGTPLINEAHDISDRFGSDRVARARSPIDCEVGVFVHRAKDGPAVPLCVLHRLHPQPCRTHDFWLSPYGTNARTSRQRRSTVQAEPVTESSGGKEAEASAHGAAWPAS